MGDIPTTTTTMSGPGECISILQLFEQRAAQFPDDPILAICDRDFRFRAYTYQDLLTASTQLANYFVSNGLIRPRPPSDRTSMLTVAILAPSSFEYAVIELALLRMGYAVVLLSVLNSAAAIAHLIKETAASHVIVHQSRQDLARAAVMLLEAETVQCQVVVQPVEANWKEHGREFERVLMPEEEADRAAFIIHSSGSTGFPKPISIKHRAGCHNYSLNYNMTAILTQPLYHGNGHSCLYRAYHSNKTIYLFPFEIPLTLNNIQRTLEGAAEAEAFFAVPYVLKLLADSDVGVRILKRFKLVTYGGAPCPDEVGDKLVQNGVKLVGNYGSTEMGQLMTSMRDFESDRDWNYVRSLGRRTKNVARYLDFIPVSTTDSEEIYELVVKEGWPAKMRSNMPDGSYATRDLFVKYPTRPGAYKYIGRLDDTLVMINGEKTNPVPMESTIKGKSTYISEAIVFGAARPYTGVLLIPSELGASLSDDAELFARVWPAIEEANSLAPVHSRVMPEMVVILPHNANVPRTDKTSLIRQKMYEVYKDLIDETYKKFEGGERYIPGQVAERRTLTGKGLEEFVSKTILGSFSVEKGNEGARVELDVNEDLFTFGVDSVKATRIRQIMQRDLDLNGTKLPLNFVFEHPSVSKLARQLAIYRSGGPADGIQDNQEALMQELVQKYGAFDTIPVVSGPRTSPPAAETVVLTGATGGLGVHLLNELLARGNISRIYCLVRASDPNHARRRVNDALAKHQLPTLDDPERKVDPGSHRVCCVPCRLRERDLGLGDSMKAIQENVSLIIHNAWAVNFNVSLESFEEEHIRGVQNLINLAINARHGRPARFFFCSSISAVAATSDSAVGEEVSAHPGDAQRTGYSRSKWVAESLCALAAKTRGVHTEVLRIGQLIADSVNGIWNETESIPLIVKASECVGALPDFDEALSWLPVDNAARSCVEIIFQSSENQGSHEDTRAGPQVWHVLNREEIRWSDFVRLLSSGGLKLGVLPVQEWLQRLRALVSSNDPSLTGKLVNLMPYWESKYLESTCLRHVAFLSNRSAVASPALSRGVVIGPENIDRLLAVWRRDGFLGS